MTCTSFLSADSVRLYYAPEPGIGAALPTLLAWKPVYFTSESFSLPSEYSRDGILGNSPTSSQIISKSQSSVSVSFSAETSLNHLLYDLIISGFSSNLAYSSSNLPFSTFSEIKNGSTQRSLVFIKLIRKEDNQHDIILFRGALVSSISLTMSSGSISSVSASFEVQDVGSDSTVLFSDVDLSTLPAEMADWTFDAGVSPDILGPSDIYDFTVINNSRQLDATATDITLTVTNDLTDYRPIRSGQYARMLAVSNTQASLSTTAYYTDGTIAEAVLSASDTFSVSFKLTDGLADVQFTLPECKIEGELTPVAGSADADLLADLDFQAIGGGSYTLSVSPVS